MRASVVNSAALAELAAELDIGDALLLGKGEDQSGGREKPSILADAMEALIGAVYLDRGWDAAEQMVMRLLGERIEVGGRRSGGPGLQDPPAGAVRPHLRSAARSTRVQRRGPGPRQGVPRGGARPGAGPAGRVGAGPRSRPSRRRPGRRGSTCGRGWNRDGRQMPPRGPGRSAGAARGRDHPAGHRQGVRQQADQEGRGHRRPLGAPPPDRRGVRRRGSRAASWSAPAGGGST